jgi:hypothetical protein
MPSADAVLPDDGSERPSALCARHPERRASIECPHCGTFACGECTVDTLWGDAICDECLRRGRAEYPVPWEQSLSPVAFIHTAYLAFAETGSLFGALPAGRVRRALGFAVLMALSTAAASALARWLFEPRHWAARAPSLLRVLVHDAPLHCASYAILLGLTALVFHGSAHALGGRASWSTAIRGVSYALAIQLLASAGAIADTVLGGRTFAPLLGLVALFYTGFALCALGQQRYGLPRGRAIAAGCTPVAVAGALGLAVWLVRVLR